MDAVLRHLGNQRIGKLRLLSPACRFTAGRLFTPEDLQRLACAGTVVKNDVLWKAPFQQFNVGF